MIYKKKQRPLNTNCIVFYDEGVHKGLFGRGEYVPIIYIADAECIDQDCRHKDEHLTFDGQIFFKRLQILTRGIRRNLFNDYA